MPFNADTLRALASEIRSLPARRDSPGGRLEAAGRLLIAAIDAGAFAAPSFAPFIVGVRQRREQEKVNGWVSAWVEAVWWLKGKPDAPPDPDGTFAADCELVAARILESARPAVRADDAPTGGAEQARAFLAWAQHEIHDGVFLRGAVGELKQRVARLLFALARPASNAAPAGDDAAARLWRFFSSVDPRQQPVGHRQFVESFHAGEPTERTLRDLHRCDMLSVGPPSSVDGRSWEHAVGHGFAGPAAVAELMAAVRGVAALGASPAAAIPAQRDESELLWTDRKVRVYKPGASEPELVAAGSLLTPLWDARPLESDSWGNILGFDDGLGDGDSIDMRLWLKATPGMVNEPPMYRPAHAPLPPFFKSGGVRRCYRPTDDDKAAVRALYAAHRNPHAPPWQCIEADLIVGGHDRAKLVELNPPALLGLLKLLAAAASKTAGKRSGRKPDTDPKADAKLAVAWKEGKGAFRTIRELADEFKMSEADARLALDRHRKRNERRVK